MQRLGRTCSALALLIGATVVPGCGGPTNLTQVANDLQTALMSMPGVADAWVFHDETYAEGFTFNVAVDAPTATRSELIAIADRIADVRISLIANYTQNVELWVTPDKPVTIRRNSHLDSAQMADDAERLRVIAEGTDGRIDWFRGDDGAANQLSVTESHTPGAALLDAVGRTAGATGLTMSVSPASPSPRTPRMSVSFPLRAQSQTSVEQFLDSVGVDVFGLRIADDGVSALQALVPADPAAAEQELSTVIEASKPVATSPMWLAWYTPSAVGGVPMFGGVVKIGDCSAPAAQIRQAALQTGHNNISTLQARLQSTLDNCTTPEATHTEWTPAPPLPLSTSPTTTLDQSRATDGVPTTGTATTVERLTPVSTGNATRSTPAVSPVRLPLPARSPGMVPSPAAGLDPFGPPPGSAQAAGPNGPPQPPAAPHRSTSRTARSTR
ncbi:hypothetical protein [Mycolicibacterium helvum]|uniref:Uncharacterized protein n=1 Tax=Mycolicibacterium helvum TaxID=1534349 RepID=A0A7I7TDN0_9MYCO|nr:hypothetical protein [Mycolicibacterium helvum]BBY66236.1 hypothetical protein MHEL_44790 [Mycolicibacterium helvum]